MRLAYVCTDPGVPAFGRKGCSVHVQEVIRALRGRGVVVELFAARLGGEPPSDLADVPVHRLPAPGGDDPAAREQALLAANHELRSALQAQGPFDAVYERQALWSFAAMEYARAAGVPGLLEVNAPLVEEQAEHRRLVDRHGAEWAAQRAFAAATNLLAVSDGVAAYLARFAHSCGHVHVIPNAVNPARFPAELAATLPASPGTMRIGFVGTLKTWHGLPVLVAAFEVLHRANPGARLLIVGDGNERQSLFADLAKRDLSAVAHLTGSVGPDEVPGLLASMDIAVAPYPRLDNFYFSPLKVFEAMAAGCAVVASRIGQIETIIRDGIDGVLCSPGDATALAKILHRLSRDPAARRRLGSSARERVLREHTWDAVAGRVLELARLSSSIDAARVEALA